MSDKQSLSREALLKTVNLIRPALATQTFIPAYNHIAFDGRHAMTHNDIAAIRVRCDFPDPCCVPGELFIKALGSFSADAVVLQRGGQDPTLLVVSGRSRLKLPTMPLKSFPFEMPEPESSGAMIQITEEVIAAIRLCLISAGSNPNHPSSMGVTLDVDGDGNAVLFATDNYTISRHRTAEPIKLPGDSPVIMPTFFCEQLISLAKAFPKSANEISLHLIKGALILEIGEEGREAVLFTKTIDDLEPLDFHKVISRHINLSQIDGKLKKIPDAFDAAFSRQLLVLGNELDKVTHVIYKNESLSLASRSQIGESDEVLGFEGPKDPYDFFVDPTYVIRGSKHCDRICLGEKVLVMGGSNNAFLHIIAHVSAPRKE